jgi:hypothetical protein
MNHEHLMKFTVRQIEKERKSIQKTKMKISLLSYIALCIKRQN